MFEPVALDYEQSVMNTLTSDWEWVVIQGVDGVEVTDDAPYLNPNGPWTGELNIIGKQWMLKSK